MKLVKFVPAVAATLVLAACSNENNAMSKSEMTMQDNAKMMHSEPMFETAAYFCDVNGKKKQVVSATYAFLNGKSDGATVTVKNGNKKSVYELKLNPEYKDGTQFANGNKTWTLDAATFSAENASKVVPVMLTDNNKIIAKNCQLAK